VFYKCLEKPRGEREIRRSYLQLAQKRGGAAKEELGKMVGEGPARGRREHHYHPETELQGGKTL